MSGSVAQLLSILVAAVSAVFLSGSTEVAGAVAAAGGAEPQLSHKRGFYDAPFDVTVTCETPGATIYYALDGSTPIDSARSSASAKVYTAPLRIAKTTCLRAQTLQNGQPPSDVVTHTYLFLSDVIARTQEETIDQGYPHTWFGGSPADYGMDPDVCLSAPYARLMKDALLAIPTVSLVTDRGLLFSHGKDPQTGGIYIFTGHLITGGSGWERPVSAELFTADGSMEFQADCGLQIQGRESRDPWECPKHSFGLRFSSQYGSPRLDYPVFGDGEVESYDALHLQGFFGNAWHHWAVDQRRRAQYVRDQWIRDALQEMGQADAGKGLYVHLYLNGIYWGLYNLCEQGDAGHYARYNGGDPQRLDAVEGDPIRTGIDPGILLNGTTNAWLELKKAVAGRDWDRITETLDVDSLIDWCIVNGFAGTQEIMPGGHWRSAGGGPDRKPWRFYSWDAERALESMNHNTVGPAFDPTGLFDDLEDVEEFRVRFADHVHKHLTHGGALTAERNVERWLRRTGEIEQAVIAESARWGDYRRDVHPFGWGPYSLYTRDTFWIPAGNRVIEDYFPCRTDAVLGQFISRGLYPDVNAPEFFIDGAARHSGPTASGAVLSMQAPSGVIWYTLDGQDPRRPAQGARVVAVHTLVAEDAAKRVSIPTQEIDGSWKGGAPFNDSSWLIASGAPGGVGYELSAGYESWISLNVEDVMFAHNRSCYIRVPFHVAIDPAKLGHMMLRIRYDDGFIAYLNGAEILRVQCPNAPGWDSGANGTHEADDSESFVVSRGLPLLRRGDNILAIHGLNSATDSFDFLISAALEAVETTAVQESGPATTAIRYDGRVTVGRTTHVRARTFHSDKWSALNEAVFTVRPDDGQ